MTAAISMPESLDLEDITLASLQTADASDTACRVTVTKQFTPCKEHSGGNIMV
jgi:hypothetical protein